MLSLRRHDPLDMAALAALFASPADMRAANPDAAWPFDSTEWAALLSPKGGDRPYFICKAGREIGHFSLRAGTVPRQRHLSFLIVAHGHRGGIGRQVVGLAEQAARDHLGAGFLTLRVNIGNPRALHLYKVCGFRVIEECADNFLMRREMT